MLVRNTPTDSNLHSPKCRQSATSASADRAGLLLNISWLDNNSVLIHVFFVALFLRLCEGLLQES